MVKIFENQMFKDISLISLGTIISQIIVVASSPILSRMYSTVDFGEFAIILAIVGVFSSVSSLKYDVAIVIESKDIVAKYLYLLSKVILFIIVILLLLFFFQTYNFVSILEVEKWHIFTAILIFFFTGLFTLQNSALNRERNYKLIAISTIVSKIFTVIIQIFFGLLGMHVGGLLIGSLTGVVASVLCIYLLYTRKNKILKSVGINLRKLKYVAIKHFRLPKYTAPQSFFNSMSHQIPVYMLGFFYGLEVVGLYWMSMRIIQMPSLLIGDAIKKVYMKNASCAYQNKEASIDLFKLTTSTMAKLIIIPVILIFFYGEDIFEFILGGQWGEAGVYSKWLFLWIGIGFVAMPSSIYLLVASKNNIGFYYDLWLLIVRVIIMSLGGLFFSAIETIIILSISGALINLILIWYVWNMLNKVDSYG